MAAVRFSLGFIEGLMRFFPALFACLFALNAVADDVRLKLLDVRFGPSADRTRIVLDIEGVVAHRVAMNAARPALTIDLPSTAFVVDGVAQASGVARGKGLIGAYEYGPAADGYGARLVFDLAEPATVKDVFILPPKDGLRHSRLVIDLTPALAADMAAQDGAIWGVYEPGAPMRVAELDPAPQPVSDPVYEPASDAATGGPAPSLKPRPAAKIAPAPVASRFKKRMIVIDAGHGGYDPGALGQGGTREKDITLAAARRMKEALQATGRYEVALTRVDDTYLNLDQRAEIARASSADLFLSIHADAIDSNSKVRGASVWTLSESASRQVAQTIASKGDYLLFDDSIADAEVGGILLDLAQRETQNQSERFAELLVPELAKVAPLVGNTHRTAGYRVLLSPDVPAVLLELAFLSNAADEKNLNNPQWRDGVAFAVTDAIDAYFDGLPPTRHAAIR